MTAMDVKWSGALGLGTSTSAFMVAYRHEAAKAIAAAKGDTRQLVAHALRELEARGFLTAVDLQRLTDAFGEAFDVVRGKRTVDDVRTGARARQVAMIADRTSSDVARALAEVCQWVSAEAAPARAPGPGQFLARNTSERGDSILLGAAVGAAIGATVGGWPGSLAGAVIGGVVGACTDPEPLTGGGQDPHGGGSGGGGSPA